MKRQDKWIFDRVHRLIGKARLEEWKDQIAAYWEDTIDGIDLGQLLQALVDLYGKKEARKLLRASRSDKVTAIVDGEARRVVNRLVAKVENVVRGPDDRLETTGLKLEEHPYSEATVIHEGNTYQCKVAGLICITGNIIAHHPDGSQTTLNVFSKWISHPFWQYGHR